MPLPRTTLAALAPLAVRDDEPLLKKTWWRVGGPADATVDAQTTAELQHAARVCHATGTPMTVLGNASNVLVADLGVRGLVVRLSGELAAARQTAPDEVELGGGVKLVGFIRKAPALGWTGLEMLAGIPGTVGGAVKMNAGTRLGEISDRLRSVGLVLADGSLRITPAAELAMRYRHGGLPDGAIVAWAKVAIGGVDPAESQRLIDEHLAYRQATQPVDVPTCGSTFRNPTGHAAGALIEACGLKGHRIGGAMVSTKHANFIENRGGATAHDIRRLIGLMQQRVWVQHRVLLEPEVQFVGDWSDWDPEETQ
jgi:UDP-N-acetylmuramate dehydrogenase